MADPRDFTGRYNTALPPDDETKFQSWTAAQSKAIGRDVSSDLHDYDLRGWWKQNPDASLTGAHLTDTYKKPNHPTFSTGSQYHGVDGHQGGQWAEQPGGSWSFTPGSTNLKMFSPDEMRGYFERVEPGNTLALPQSQSFADRAIAAAPQSSNVEDRRNEFDPVAHIAGAIKGVTGTDIYKMGRDLAHPFTPITELDAYPQPEEAPPGELVRQSGVDDIPTALPRKPGQ